MRTRIINDQAILALLDSFQELRLEIWYAWVIIVFKYNFMKSSGAVYEASLCMFALGFDYIYTYKATSFVSLQNHLAFPSKVTWMCP